MRKTGWVMAAAAVLLAGCATSNGAPIYTTQTGSIAWADMTGLTQDQLRERLGLRPTGEHVADRAVIDGDVLVTSIRKEQLIRTLCGGGRKNYHGQPSLSHGLITLNFRDGRMSGYEETGQVRTGTGPDKPLVATCREARDHSLLEELSYGQNAMIVPALLIAPVTLTQKMISDGEQAQRTKAFAELRLGEPPPGGLEAWAKANAKLASVSTAADGRTEITFYSPSNGIDFWRHAYLADGKVVELQGSPPGVCVMRPDRSMLCDMPYRLNLAAS